jgi:aminoglycoside phosphotransferase (APT) family kinase protein
VTPPGRAAQLAPLLASATGADRAVVEAQATGGLSQETWFVTIERDGVTQRAVLRLPTLASGPRSIVTQRIALGLTHAHGLPVPGLIAYDDTVENPFGAPYLIMERCVGEVASGWNSVTAQRRRTLGLDAMRVLAELQRIPVARATSSGLRVPKTDPAAEELAYYRRRFAVLNVDTAGTVEVALRWLERNRPDSDARVVVHNDYRMGNFVVGENAISAVLDWELAAIGHPVADLTWCFIAVWDVPEVDREEMFAAYEEASGRRVDPSVARWYTAMGYLRLLYYGLSGGAAFVAGDLRELRQPAIRLQAPMRLDRLLRVIDGEPPD